MDQEKEDLEFQIHDINREVDLLNEEREELITHNEELQDQVSQLIKSNDNYKARVINLNDSYRKLEQLIQQLLSNDRKKQRKNRVNEANINSSIIDSFIDFD